MITPPLVVRTSSISPSQRSPLSSITRPPFVVEPRTAPPTRLNMGGLSGRGQNFKTHVPVVIAIVFRSARENSGSAGFDSDLFCEVGGFGVSRRARFHTCAQQHLVLLPPLYRD